MLRFACAVLLTKTKARATIEDLYTLPDNAKAEIVDGEIVLMSPSGAVTRVFCRGDIADAERTVPGWRMTVDELFS